MCSARTTTLTALYFPFAEDIKKSLFVCLEDLDAIQMTTCPVLSDTTPPYQRKENYTFKISFLPQSTE